MRWMLMFVLCLPCLGGETLGGEVLVEVEDSRLRAGDLSPVIGDVAAPAVDLGPAPAPGVRRRVKRAQLARWAQSAGAPAADLPEEILLVRKMRAWPRAEASETLRGLLAEQTGATVSVDLVGFTENEIPAGEIEWSLLGTPRLSGLPVRMSLSWKDPGGRTGVESVTASARARVRALVARRDLDAGTELTPVDFEWTEADVTDSGTRYLVSIPNDRRAILNSSLMSGQPLAAALIEERPELERGALVELVVAVGAVRLRAPARAEGAGVAGDLVPFRNLETNQRVLARVVDGKTAEVTSR